MLEDAGEIIDLLPEDHLGHCVLIHGGDLFDGSPADLKDALDKNQLLFHEGSVCGAWPRIRPLPPTGD
ncbi:MAG: hypothetical protein HN919_12260 [Verrucomicrobia bacterium]|jgi:hypothetical protein|nr:hypothetical protein [Verrucomicrobiota bacterium]MBT7067071.1 hypothetical protein [Verrucomicrobiota bacterium]MBT7700031.1 hypothetical protein [Verrucomicrobiota bacterium]